MEQTSIGFEGRGSADAWVLAAHELLLESGVDAVRILPLAKKLGLARTSFYWSFKDREELLAALLRRWVEKNTGNIVARSKAYAETMIEALLNVSDCWFDQDLFDSRLEFAVRSWALQSQPVLARVREADARRIEAISAMFTRHGETEALADARARTTYLLQIGYHSMQTVEDVHVRMARMPDYMRVLTGREPTDRELDRFFARHHIVRSNLGPGFPDPGGTAVLVGGLQGKAEPHARRRKAARQGVDGP